MHEDSPLLEAISLWEELTGVAPPDEKGYWGSSAGMNTWAIRDTYKALKEALELDPTEITATLLLKRFVEEYMKEATTSLNDMLRNPEQAMKQMASAKKLLDILDREEIVSARDNFIAGLTRGLAAYGAADRDDVKAVLAKHDDIAILRRDALRSLANLRCDQFLEGDSEAADYRPVYVNDVHLWWNVNSLLKAMTSLPSGVSLNLIRDPNAYESYFAFAIRNGGNLFVLTDVPEHAHPLQSTMTRKPGREFDRRSAKNWFPYDLLGMEVDEKGDSYKPTHSEATGLVLYQESTIPMMKIGAVPPHECIWITMMLDLIVMKFWKIGFKAKQLSYTGEMIQVQNTLLIEAAKADLPAVIDKPLEMPALTVDDMTLSENLDAGQIGKMYDQPNQWLLDRYKERITDESLNLLAGPGEVRKLTVSKDGAPEIAEYLPIEQGGKYDENGRHIWSTEQYKVDMRRTELQVLSGTKFGTPAELEADRRFLARYNVAKQVNMYALREYEERKEEVQKWFEKKVQANRENLIRWALNEGIYLNSGVFGGFASNSVSGVSYHLDTQEPDDTAGGSPGANKKKIVHGFIRHYDLITSSKHLDYGDLMSRHAGFNLGTHHHDSRGRYTGEACAVNGAKASTSTIFFPSNSREIAVLCGCEVKDLPDVLQTWVKVDPYRGNSILDRIDPMVWKVRNPWEKLDLRVKVPFSISGRIKAQKTLGPTLPALPNIMPMEVMIKARGDGDDFKTQRRLAGAS